MSEANNDEPCEMLPWDTDFFGFPIARVKKPYLITDMAEPIDAWCRANRVRCLYVNLASFGAFPAANVAEEMGFRLVDVKQTMLHMPGRVSPPPHASIIRPARTEDLPVLEPMAAKNHAGGRFTYDLAFPRGKGEEMFRVWIRKFVTNSVANYREPESGTQYHCLVAETDGRLSGYAALDIQYNGNIGSISLLGVDEGVRRKGVGYDLVHAALAYFASQRTPTISLVTQAFNFPAQRLYQRCGFITSGCVFVYHKWYSHG